MVHLIYGHAQLRAFPAKPIASPTRWNSHQQLAFGRMMACFPTNYLINTNFLQKCFVIPLKAIIFFLSQEWHVVISAWLLLMQCNLILLGTSYSSYICLIIQQLIGISHNCWYKKDKKKYSSPYIPRIHPSWAWFTYPEFGKYVCLQIFPIFMGEGLETWASEQVCPQKCLGSLPGRLVARDKGSGRWAQHRLFPQHPRQERALNSDTQLLYENTWDILNDEIQVRVFFNRH